MAIILNHKLDAEEHKDVSGLYDFIRMLELELDNYISEPSAYLWYIRIDSYEMLHSDDPDNATAEVRYKADQVRLGMPTSVCSSLHVISEAYTRLTGKSFAGILLSRAHPLYNIPR